VPQTAGSLKTEVLSEAGRMDLPAQVIQEEHRKRWTVSLFFLAAGLFLYLQVFVFPNIPRCASGDQAIYLLHATRMLQGDVIYRDFSHFTPPATELIYTVLFKLFGVFAWIPQAMLVAVGTLLAWLSVTISRKVLTGPAVYLPSLLFLVFPFSGFLDATHHWYSTLAVTTALAVLLEKRSAARLTWAGALSGLAASIAQTQALVAVGFALFLFWEGRRNCEPWRLVLKRAGYLLSSFLAVMLAFNAYFVWKVGLRLFFYSTVVFVAKYYPADRFNNWRVYLAYWPSAHVWANWPDLSAWFTIQALIPLVYVLFFLRYALQSRLRPEQPWARLMLVNLTGVCMFLAVAPSPSYVRLYCVSLPGLILLSWFLNSPGKSERILRRIVWAAVVVVGIVRPVIAQVRWRGCLDLPTGRTAFFEPALYEKCRWLSERTRPSQYFFGDPFLCFTLGLRNPARVPFVRPTDYTRPEEVDDVVRALEQRQVRFVNWYNGVDAPSRSGDHLAPLRLCLATHYHLAETFSNLDQIWERNSRIDGPTEPLAAAGEGR